jgi:hypothetical protein
VRFLVSDFAAKCDLDFSFIEREHIYDMQTREYYTMGKYQCTVDLLFDWFGLVCFEDKNKNRQLSYS